MATADAQFDAMSAAGDSPDVHNIGGDTVMTDADTALKNENAELTAKLVNDGLLEAPRTCAPGTWCWGSHIMLAKVADREKLEGQTYKLREFLQLGIDKGESVCDNSIHKLQELTPHDGLVCSF